MKYAIYKLCNNTLHLNFILNISYYIEILYNYMILHLTIKTVALRD